jgi:perosamine synthetase
LSRLIEKKDMREKMLPYGRQSIDEDDIEAVVRSLRSDWLTTGPTIAEFEREFAQFVGVKEAVAVSSGTAALHASVYAAGIGPGDEVIVPPITFVATANCVVYQGGHPIFADVDPKTLLIDPTCVETKITPQTKAIISVDYAGQPCDYDALKEIARKNGLALIVDACHAVGGKYKGQAIGCLGDLNVFSFHPVKQLTTGEGGIVTTNNVEMAQSMRTFRNHGIAQDHWQRSRENGYQYQMVNLGYNYRITDFQCALGLSQLQKLPSFLQRRSKIAAIYDTAFAELSYVRPLDVRPHVEHAYHLYVVQFDSDDLGMSRDEIFAALRAENIGVGVHYTPVHLQPFYRDNFGAEPGLCPNAEQVSAQILSLPIFPQMTGEDAEYVINAISRLGVGR